MASGQIPRLVLEVVAVGAGAGELRAPWLRRLARRGVGGFDARPGSLPLEPAAVLTTIGTGGLPRQHGIVGARVRNDEGKLVDSWGRGSPLSVIATLGDDLDEVLRQRPKIGLVAGNRSERGLIGGTWYVGTDRDDVSVGGGPVKRARAVLSKGFGRDEVPDLLGVTISQGPDRFDRSLRRLVEAGTAASGGSLVVVVTATGPFQRGLPAARVARVVERRVGRGVIEAATASGLFTVQKVLARRGISEDDVAAALERVRGRGGRPLTVDQFPAIAVAFARYC